MTLALVRTAATGRAVLCRRPGLGRLPTAEPLRAPAHALPGPNDRPTRAPDGLVFHMSRCSSTLAAQMLAASPAHVVISEAPPIDAVAAARPRRRRQGPGAAGHGHRPGPGPCGRNPPVPQARLLAGARPAAVPARLPRDALDLPLSRAGRGAGLPPASTRRADDPRTGPVRTPGPRKPGAPDADYCAQVLAALCEAATRHYPAGGGRLVHYDEVPEALFDEGPALVRDHAFPDDEAAAMRAAAARRRQGPDRGFVPDGEANARRPATTCGRSANGGSARCISGWRRCARGGLECIRHSDAPSPKPPSFRALCPDTPSRRAPVRGGAPARPRRLPVS